MIIANAFKTVFDGLPIDIISNGETLSTTVKFGYGDQKELIKWVDNENKKSTPSKYPLIWYVLDSFTEFQDEYDTNVKFVLMTLTREEVFNEWRTSNNYIGVLKPLYDLIVSTLSTTNGVQVMGDLPTRYTQFDEPNFGVDRRNPTSQANDFSSKSQQSEKSISTDFVDAKIVTFKALIKPKCII